MFEVMFQFGIIGILILSIVIMIQIISIVVSFIANGGIKKTISVIDKFMTRQLINLENVLTKWNI